MNKTLAAIQETLLVDIPDEEAIPVDEFIKRTEVSELVAVMTLTSHMHQCTVEYMFIGVHGVRVGHS